jgi:hypothetical protein
MFFVFLFFLYKINAEKFCVKCVHFKKPFIGNKLFGKCVVFPKETNIDKKIDYLIFNIRKKMYNLCIVQHKDSMNIFIYL